MDSPLIDYVKEDLETFVNDVEVLLLSDNDFLIIDTLVARLEKFTGAFLNRRDEYVVLGLGQWIDTDVRPLEWPKTVKVIKVFGLILHPDYPEIVELNWKRQLSKFSATLKSLSSPAIDSKYQKAEILKPFASYKI